MFACTVSKPAMQFYNGNVCFFRKASWCWQSWVPTVWLSYWVTYFPSGQHAVAIREYLLFPQSVDTKPRWMLSFVRLLLTGEMWNLLQIDVKWCTVALKGHLILQPCTVSYHSYLRCTWSGYCSSRCSAGPEGLGTAVHTARRRGGRRPSDTLSKTTVELSHTVTQYSQGKAFERGIVSSTTTPLCCAAPEEARFLLLQLNRASSAPAGARAACWGRQAELLNGASHVSITWSIKQHVRGRLTCLFDFGGQRDFWQNSEMCKEWEKVYLPQRMCKGSWVICRLNDLSLSQFIAQEIQFYAA